MKNREIKNMDKSKVEYLRSSLRGKLSLFFSFPFMLLFPIGAYVSSLEKYTRGEMYYSFQGFLTILVGFSVLLSAIGLVLGIMSLFKKGKRILPIIGMILNFFCLVLAFYVIMHVSD